MASNQLRASSRPQPLLPRVDPEGRPELPCPVAGKPYTATAARPGQREALWRARPEGVKGEAPATETHCEAEAGPAHPHDEAHTFQRADA